MGDTRRIFAKQELEEFSKDFMGLAMEALERGDIEQAKHWVRRQDETKDALHDLYLHWVAGLLSHIYDRFGEDAAVAAVKETACHGQSGFSLPILKTREKLIAERGLRGYVEWIVDLCRQHSMYPGFAVEEDDEKVILTLRPCGSGGRLIDMGAYEGPLGYRRLKKAGPHTWGEADLPIYCSHCPWVHEITPLFYGGEGSQFWVHAAPFPKQPGDPCAWHIYKEPARIPDKYYERIGMTRTGRTLAPTSGLTPRR